MVRIPGGLPPRRRFGMSASTGVMNSSIPRATAPVGGPHLDPTHRRISGQSRASSISMPSLRRVLSSPVQAFTGFFRLVPEVAADATWIENRQVERENPWALAFRFCAKYKIPGLIAFSTLVTTAILTAYSITPIGAALNAAVTATHLGKAWFIFVLSFAVDMGIGLTVPRRDLRNCGGVGWLQIFRTAVGNTLRTARSAFILGAVGFWLLPDALLNILPDSGPALYNFVRQAPLGLGGFLWIVGSFFVVPTAYALWKAKTKAHHEPPPTTWGWFYKMASKLPLLGSAYLVAASWIIINGFTHYSYFGPRVSEWVDKNAWGPSLFVLLTVWCFPTIRALFFDRHEGREIKKEGKSLWDWAAVWGKRMPVFSRSFAMAFGVFGVLDHFLKGAEIGFGNALTKAADLLPWGLGDTVLWTLGSLCIAVFFGIRKKGEI